MVSCSHQWSMVHIRNGFLVVEGCAECGGRSSFFSTDSLPPVDDYHDGPHYWTYLGSSQAVKFDLSCSRCGTTVSLEDMMGLMLSTCVDPECEVARTAMESGHGSWVYVALCADSTHRSGKCVSEAGIAALNEYFNQQLKAPGKRIMVVPCKLAKSLDTCRGIVIADTGLTDIY